MSTAIATAVAERGPVVIAVPGDVAVANAPSGSLRVPLPATTIGAASDGDVAAMAVLINQAETVAIFGGDGCAEAQDEVRALAARLKAPVGYSLKGKAWLEHDNPNAVGMTGLLGYGGCHAAINNADLLLMLGTDFPFSDFLPHKTAATDGCSARSPGRRWRAASPYAFGAAMAFPGRQVIALCGDGRFTMGGLGDLLTQVQRKARVVNVIINNGTLDFVNLEQQEAGIVPFGTEFTNPDFSQVATALGARGIRVEEPGDLRAALQTALAHTDGPVVLDVVVDRYALSLPSRIRPRPLRASPSAWPSRC